LIFDAIDSKLERPVCVVRTPVNSDAVIAHRVLTKKAANQTDSRQLRVYDTLNDNQYQWTVTESARGNILSGILRFKGRRSAEEAAKIVSTVADLSFLEGESWICPENVWVHREGVSVSALVPPSGGYADATDAIESLGLLLWHCVAGTLEEEFHSERATWVPTGMLSIISRCLGSGADTFKTTNEVAGALRSYNWTPSESSVSPGKTLDREELLATLNVTANRKRWALWDRIFGRKAS
jgi:hypothetical protein